MQGSEKSLRIKLAVILYLRFRWRTWNPLKSSRAGSNPARSDKAFLCFKTDCNSAVLWLSVEKETEDAFWGHQWHYCQRQLCLLPNNSCRWLLFDVIIRSKAREMLKFWLMNRILTRTQWKHGKATFYSRIFPKDYAHCTHLATLPNILNRNTVSKIRTFAICVRRRLKWTCTPFKSTWWTRLKKAALEWGTKNACLQFHD